MATERTINLNIAKRLRDNEEFRKEYFRTRSRNEIAEQLFRLRKMRKMRQADLAKAAGTQQSAISRLEKADYASWNNQTLEGIAEVLNARWRHILEPTETVIQQYEREEEELTLDKLQTDDMVRLFEDLESVTDGITEQGERSETAAAETKKAHTPYTLLSKDKTAEESYA